MTGSDKSTTFLNIAHQGLLVFNAELEPDPPSLQRTCSNSLHGLSSDSLLSQVLYPRVPAFDQYLGGGGEVTVREKKSSEDNVKQGICIEWLLFAKSIRVT